MTLASQIEEMFRTELQLGGRAAYQYALLAKVKKRELTVDGLPCVLIYNPGRVKSVMADVSPSALANRPCFLCPDGLEHLQQTYEWEKYYIRVNPFPIFRPHFTISSVRHEPQHLTGHYADMLRLAALLPEYCIFYNGPHCGASAPDHMHFQAIPIGTLPLRRWCDIHMPPAVDPLTQMQPERQPIVQQVPVFCPSAYLLTSRSLAQMEQALWQLIDSQCSDYNVISWVCAGYYRSLIFFRSKSRPDCFYAEDPAERLLFSPATVEMAGVAVVASEDTFERMTAERLRAIIRACRTRKNIQEYNPHYYEKAISSQCRHHVGTRYPFLPKWSV